MCSKKYGVIQSSTWAEHTIGAIYDLDIGDLECPGLSSSVGDQSNEEKTLNVVNGDINADIYDIIIDDDPVDIIIDDDPNSMRKVQISKH